MIICILCGEYVLRGERWKVNPSMQNGQRDFAEMWLSNIKEQQGI